MDTRFSRDSEEKRMQRRREKAFGGFFGKNRANSTIRLTALQEAAFRAMKVHEMAYVCNEFSEREDVKRAENALLNFKNALQTVRDSIRSPDINRYYALKAKRNASRYSDRLIHDDPEKLYQYVDQHLTSLTFDLTGHKKNGRPSLEEFYNFVYYVAKAYEDISGLPFKFDSLKGDSGKYLEITSSHRFVRAAVDWIHEEYYIPTIASSPNYSKYKYTDENIVTACDKVRTRLNKERSDKGKRKSR